MDTREIYQEWIRNAKENTVCTWQCTGNTRGNSRGEHAKNWPRELTRKCVSKRIRPPTRIDCAGYLEGSSPKPVERWGITRGTYGGSWEIIHGNTYWKRTVSRAPIANVGDGGRYSGNPPGAHYKRKGKHTKECTGVEFTRGQARKQTHRKQRNTQHAR